MDDALADLMIQTNHEGEAPLGTRDHLAEEKATFEGGATRSEKLERFDLIPGEATIVNARRFGLGAQKHGARNWQGGGADFIAATVSHLEGHIASLKMNGPFHSDDDIGAAITNASMLAWFRAHKPTEFLTALGMSETKKPEA